MHTRKLSTPLFLTLVIGVLLGLNIALFFFEVRDGRNDNLAKDIFAGKVLEITDETVSVVDARNVTKTYALTSETKLIEGKDVVSLETIHPGMFVLVTSKQKTGQELEAKEVRIMTTGPFKKQEK